MACLDDAVPVASFDIAEMLPGGEGSVKFRPFASYELPAANLPVSARPKFHAGKALANQAWIKAPTITDARDGLGPLYNARTCLACHVNGGRGQLPDNPDQPLFSGVLRLSLPGRDSIRGAVPDPVYGEQLQVQSVALSHQFRGRIRRVTALNNPEPPPEAQVYIDWQEHVFEYPDGQHKTLRRPRPRIDELGYGPLPAELQISLRAAPAIHGMGLIEAIPQAAIDALADAHDEDDDGISGRVNRVWDPALGHSAPGRFGWKANRSSLRVTVAAAFQGDVGISNPLFAAQPCTAAQSRCRRQVSGAGTDGFELPEGLLDLTTEFVRNIGVPVARPALAQEDSGRQYFYEVGCVACHHPSFQTGAQAGDRKHLGNQRIWPYSDLLLHDMGEGLADGRPDYEANGREWRTPPLWGIGLSKSVNGTLQFLHDGRAKDLEEAILWHAGEATAAQQAFVMLDVSARQELLRFLESL
ncbi:MAG: di-heme oxidoredictase family protein [Pseudomonadota bacterium]